MQADMSLMENRAVPFDQRWEILKPEIIRLWLGERVKLKDLVSIMKERHDFQAAEPHYKYRFKQWGIKRSLSSEKKNEIIRIELKRVRVGVFSARIPYQRPVDIRNIRRHAKQLARVDIKLQLRRPGGNSSMHDISMLPLPFKNMIFLGWNIPYAALIRTVLEGTGHRSLFGSPTSSPTNISVQTLPAILGNCRGAPSPLSATLIKAANVKNAHLFAQGQYTELVNCLSPGERRTMSTWLYHFWIFAFKTAKHWGRGPREWNADNLSLHGLLGSIPLSPMPSSVSMNRSLPSSSSSSSSRLSTPTQLCRWAVHISPADYDELDDTDDEEWPASWSESCFVERLCDNLGSNAFSNINSSELPLAISHIAAAASRSPNELLKEAVGFAILGRSNVLLRNLAKKVQEQKLDLSDLYPYHLAAVYLDGATSCCLILSTLLFKYGSLNPCQKMYINDLGHTILDSLFITILRSHTTMPPGMIDLSFRKENRWPGEEVDVCGRWEPDSDCYKQLLAAGQSSVPENWKHSFCHTSVQAVCHFLSELRNHAVPIAIGSGLFRRLCPNCGLTLQLSSLHSLVLVSYYLLTYGLDGEDLFGTICCLRAMVECGADPRDKSDVSVALLLDLDPGTLCSHTILTSSAFADLLPTKLGRTQTELALLGWDVFRNVLRLAESDLCPDSDSDSNSDIDPESETDLENGNSVDRYSFCFEDCWELFQARRFYKRSQLGSIWAAAQTELLNYRRLKEGDTWTSSNFNMEAVLRGLLGGVRPSIPLTTYHMMKPHCACGRFGQFALKTRREDTSWFDFSNMSHPEDWERISLWIIDEI